MTVSATIARHRPRRQCANLTFLTALGAALLSAPSVAFAEAASDQTGGLRSALDASWIMTAAALVFLMQIGFLMLEGGMVRSKNSINVAQKNLSDFALSLMCFAVAGFMVMFGASWMGLLGAEGRFFALADLDAQTMVFFVFQAAFCSAAATIVSGAVAERFSYRAYMLLVAAIALVIYPVFGHWSWGSALHAENDGAFLASMGFVDFAGSTVVHSVGAWAALAAVLAVGARNRPLGPDGKPIAVQGHSALLASAGAMFLMVGWIGFNAGSGLAASVDIGPIVANTVLAAAAGAVAACVLGGWIDGLYRPERLINGLLGGLVAITAGCEALGVQSAMLLGLVGGLVAVFGADLLARAGVDDAVGAIATHGFAGAVGTIALAVLAPIEALPAGDRVTQFGVQSLGVAICFVWTFGVAWAVLKAIALVTPLRVGADAEEQGLNAAEHDASLGTGEVQALLAKVVDDPENLDLSMRLRVEPGDEAAELAQLMNRLLQMLEADQRHKEALQVQAQLESDALSAEREGNIRRWRAERDAERAVVADIGAVLHAVAQGDFSRRTAVEKSSDSLRAVGEGVNKLLDHLVGLIAEVGDGARRLAAQTDTQRAQAARLSANVAEQEAESRTVNEEVRAISATIEDASSQAAETREATCEINAEAATSAAAVEQAAMAMEEIRAQSGRIADVVGMIEEIARKTNMLSINAAVEAARAGENGNSFGIVAGEVRTLASATQNLAEEINRKVADTQKAIEGGVSTVGAATDALSVISSSAAVAERKMRAIEERARSQVEQVQSVLKSIEQIARHGRDNKLLAAEGAISADTVAEEALRLSRLAPSAEGDAPLAMRGAQAWAD